MPGSLKWSEKESTRKSSDTIAHGRKRFLVVEQQQQQQCQSWC
jgi:hypothetical protein